MEQEVTVEYIENVAKEGGWNPYFMGYALKLGVSNPWLLMTSRKTKTDFIEWMMGISGRAKKDALRTTGGGVPKDLHGRRMELIVESINESTGGKNEG